MPLIVVNPLEEEPVTLDEVKQQCRVTLTDTEQDDLLTIHAKSARQWLEDITGRAFGETTYELVLDRFPCRREEFDAGRLRGPHIKLPRSPLIEVESVKYIDEDGTLTTLDTSDYLVDSDSVPARVAPAFDTTWPVTQCRPNAVRVRFRAGYANGADSPATEQIPEPLRQALLLKVQSLYDGIDLSGTIDALIYPYRTWSF